MAGKFIGTVELLPHIVQESVGTVEHLQYAVRKFIGMMELLPYAVRKSVGAVRLLPHTVRKFIGVIQSSNHVIGNKYCGRQKRKNLILSIGFLCRNSYEAGKSKTSHSSQRTAHRAFLPF